MSFQQAKESIQRQISQFKWADKELLLMERKRDILPGSKYAVTRAHCVAILDAAIQDLQIKKQEAENLLSGLTKSDYVNDKWVDNLRKNTKLLREIEKEAVKIIDTATTKADGNAKLEGYDALIFINMDYAVDDNVALLDADVAAAEQERLAARNQGNPHDIFSAKEKLKKARYARLRANGLGMGIRQKQVANRGVTKDKNSISVTHPPNWDKCITVRSYPLAHNSAKLYIEITIEHPIGYWKEDPANKGYYKSENYKQLFDRLGVPSIQEFSNLTVNSKIQIAGHGGFGSDSVTSDHKSHETEISFRMPIEAICELISYNISKHSRVQFNNWMQPLRLESQSCQAGGLDGGGELRVEPTGAIIESRGQDPTTGLEVTRTFSIEQTMAGQFLTGLRNRNVIAQIKARTTSSLSVKTKGRSNYWDKNAGPSEYYRPDLPDASYEGAAQIRRAEGLTTGLKFGNYGHNKYTFQGPGPARQHGLKRLFYYDDRNVMKCKDLSNDEEVDLFFEANKDRVLLYIARNIERMQNAWVGNVEAKRNKLFNLVFAVEAAPNYAMLEQAIRNMALDPDISSHRNQISRAASFFSGRETTTVTILTRLANLVNKASRATGTNKLIPKPDNRPNAVALGLT